MISIVQQRKHIEGFFLRFDLIDKLCEEAFHFCDSLIMYLEGMYLEDYDLEYFTYLMRNFPDRFISLLPITKTDILVYQALKEYIEACDEFLEHYKNSDKVYKCRKLQEYRSILSLKKSFMRTYEQMVRRIEGDFQRKIRSQFPELVKSVYKCIVLEITDSNIIQKEFNNAILSLVEDIEYVYHIHNFEELERLNSELSKATQNFLLGIKSEILKDLGYEDYEAMKKEERVKVLKNELLELNKKLLEKQQKKLTPGVKRHIQSLKAQRRKIVRELVELEESENIKK